MVLFVKNNGKAEKVLTTWGDMNSEERSIA